MRIESYDFDLPEALVAQRPVEPRHAARLLVIDRQSGELRHHRVADLPNLLPKGAVLVVNDTKVVPARLRAHKASGGAVELLLERPLGATDMGLQGQPVLYKSSKGLRVGQELSIEGGARALVVDVSEGGRARVDLSGAGDLAELLQRCGHVPLPPYIRGGRDDDADKPRYQCTYARHAGAVAAPTAGLHLSTELLTELESAGIPVLSITLHVGPGTFLPVRQADLSRHQVLPERYAVDAETAEKLSTWRAQGRPIVAIGTTTTRVLEHLGRRAEGTQLPAGMGETDMTIVPGHRFAVVDHLLTNFHLPQSSLLVLVASLLGRERALAAYRCAVDQGYRFYSYGDASLIL
ncbi:MAG: tRNA preQ1(34) S-adenosylmethionine ribosyltransferase-isomerase QueA [Deltaproteobacteria bacterium]|nr:tRNA preQ1(34) S-adenosylmethionine ribosyltransferase-isomerase QueA [Deltaproteobacteria bacterium]